MIIMAGIFHIWFMNLVQIINIRTLIYLLSKKINLSDLKLDTYSEKCIFAGFVSVRGFIIFKNINVKKTKRTPGRS